MKLRRLVIYAIAVMLLISGASYLLIDNLEVAEAGNIIYVGTGAGNDTNSIQYAIDNFAVSGDTVYVHKGTYLENIVIDKTISLMGEDRSVTMIDGQGADTVHVNAHWVNITGFTVTGGGYGIHADSASHLSITGNIVDFNSEEGIYISHTPTCLVSQNTLTNNKYGIHIRDSSNETTVINNIVSDNVQNGIYLSKLSYNRIESNQIKNNGGNGIYLFTGFDVSIRYNSLMNNSYGVYMSSSSMFNTISNNDIEDNNNGIRLGMASNNTISGNNVIMNQNNGIQLHSSSMNNTVMNNNVSANLARGSISLSPPEITRSRTIPCIQIPVGSICHHLRTTLYLKMK